MNITAADLILSHTFFKLIGALVVSYKLLSVTGFVYRKFAYYVRELTGFSYLKTDIGKWAIVTGGTDGIGKCYAEELAKRGFSICIISRNEEKLKTAAKEFEEKYGVDTKTIKIDFTGRQDIYEVIEKELLELNNEIGILVNNVGMSYKFAEYFHTVPGGSNFMMDLINSNITSCTMMMKIVLPHMLKKKKGIVINISSLMAVYPMPFLATYAACKAYVDHLSRAVQYEYKNTGIIIQSVLPGYVATKMSNRRPRIEVPSAQSFASSAIKTVGFEDYTYGYIAHRIRGFVHEFLKAHMPTCVNMGIAVHVMKKNRESYYRKKQIKMISGKKLESSV